MAQDTRYDEPMEPDVDDQQDAVAGEPTPPKTDEDTPTASALLPKDFFGGKTPQVGETLEVTVKAIGQDEVTVELGSAEAISESASEPSGAAPAPEPANDLYA